MSGHVPSSSQDLPLMGEIGSLCPRLLEPVKSKKPAPEVKSTTVEEDGIPDLLMVPEVAPALLKYENHQWACWSCRIKFFVAIKDLMSPPKRSKPKNRLAGIKDPAVRDFIIAAEERLAKAKSGKAPEEKPKCTYPTKFEDIDFSTATVMTTEEDFAAFLEEHPFGLKEPKEGSVRRMFYVDECTEFRCSGSCSGDLLRDTFEQAATSKPALLKTLQFLEDILTAKAEQLGGLRRLQGIMWQNTNVIRSRLGSFLGCRPRLDVVPITRGEYIHQHEGRSTRDRGHEIELINKFIALNITKCR